MSRLTQTYIAPGESRAKKEVTTMQEKAKIKVKVPLKKMSPTVGDMATLKGSKLTGLVKPPSLKPRPAAHQTVADETVELWDIDKLFPHPLQEVHFDHRASPDMENLREDIRANGVREPIKILPTGAVLDGESRRLICQGLGHQQMKVIVMHNLAARGETAIELFMIEANTSRRQLSKLAQARLYLRVRDLREQSKMPTGRGKLRDEFAKRFGMTGRNFDRYVELLQHPKDVQDAVANKKLALVTALQLMKLPPEEYEPILKMLREGRDVRKKVNRLSQAFERSPVTKDKLTRLLRDFLRLYFQLEKERDQVAGLMLPHHVGKLEDLQNLCEFLLAAQKKRESSVEEESDDPDGEFEEDDGFEDEEAEDDELAA